MTKLGVDFKAIRAAAEFRPVLEHYGITLKARGPELTGLCPFHLLLGEPTRWIGPSEHRGCCRRQGHSLGGSVRRGGVPL